MGPGVSVGAQGGDLLPPEADGTRDSLQAHAWTSSPAVAAPLALGLQPHAARVQGLMGGWESVICFAHNADRALPWAPQLLTPMPGCFPSPTPHLPRGGGEASGGGGAGSGGLLSSETSPCAGCRGCGPRVPCPVLWAQPCPRALAFVAQDEARPRRCPGGTGAAWSERRGASPPPPGFSLQDAGPASRPPTPR